MYSLHRQKEDRIISTLIRSTLALSVALTLLLCPMVKHAAATKPTGSPNILFFIMDDVGIDQMKIFGYGGATPPRTPNIDAIASAGVRFRNVWAMPECSPTRAMFFEGRYPFRTNVFSAILSEDLANSQVSPYEITTPQVLRQKGYISALIGKFHLSGSEVNPENNPLGPGVPRALGWDYFAGFLDGAPYPIDTTAGGVGPVDPETQLGPYGCGFVPNADSGEYGADEGACYFADSRPCEELFRTSEDHAPGRSCLEQGGIFVPNVSCGKSPPDIDRFNKANAYYVSNIVINNEDGSIEQVPLTDPRARVYRSVLESDWAIEWIQKRPANTPWMATVSYSSAHAPYQQPPTALLPEKSIDTNRYNCTAEDQIRVLSNQMIESMDYEIGRVMVETGLANRGSDGNLEYHPEETNTMVIIIGDNGTYFPGVKLPFTPLYSKGTPYQTGVWVPLIVAGPLVNTPDRDVEHMINVADLFELFGEIAGVDVHKVVPKSHILDSVSMLPYLTNPNHGRIRKTNFTQITNNLRATDTVIYPCVLNPETVNTCLEVFPQSEVCIAEGGVWYGPGGAAGPDGLESCCAVSEFLEENNQKTPNILPDSQLAIRNDSFKLVQIENTDCKTGEVVTTTEFYEIDEQPDEPKIDRPARPGENNLLTTQPNLTPKQRANFKRLSADLQKLLDSQPPPCPGDGNLDRVVNGEDITNWKFFSKLNGEYAGYSSWYDFNLDGFTDEKDLRIIRQNLGTKCLKNKDKKDKDKKKNTDL